RDIACAQALARAVGDAVPEVRAIYFVGSRLEGTAHAESDFDFMALVSSSLRPQSPTWAEKGSAPAPGFASTCEGAPVHWCLLSAEDFDPSDFARTADFRATPVLLVYERARAVPTPVPTSEKKEAD